MSFQIHALPAEPFQRLFSMNDEELRARNAKRVVVEECPGSPCRVSLKDAAVGETVILLHYEHQPAATSYRASHAIFVRADAAQTRPTPGEAPEVLRRRLLSVRAFDATHEMVNAEVVEGADLETSIARLLRTKAPPTCTFTTLCRVVTPQGSPVPEAARSAFVACVAPPNAGRFLLARSTADRFAGIWVARSRHSPRLRAVVRQYNCDWAHRDISGRFFSTRAAG